MAESHGGVTPPLAVVFAAVGFFALLIGGYGVVSLLSDTDVVTARGAGNAPGVLGAAAATVAFTLMVWAAVRAPRPTFPRTVGIMVVTVAAGVLGLFLGAVAVGATVADAFGIAADYAVSPFLWVLVAAAFIASWGAIALVRTRSGRPRWPWENER